jgi:hypothetical protein
MRDLSAIPTGRELLSSRRSLPAHDGPLHIDRSDRKGVVCPLRPKHAREDSVI